MDDERLWMAMQIYAVVGVVAVVWFLLAWASCALIDRWEERVERNREKAKSYEDP
jgi:hypothetical protein